MIESWVSTSAINRRPLTSPELAQQANSYVARFLAQVGRVTWLSDSTLVDSIIRTDIFLSTPDQRIHAAGDSSADGTDFQFKGPSAFPSGRGEYHYSMYGHLRYSAYPATRLADQAWRWALTS